MQQNIISNTQARARALFEPEKGGGWRVRIIEFNSAGQAFTRRIKAEHIPRRAAHRLAKSFNRQHLGRP